MEKNQLTRYGAFSRGVPGNLLAPGAKLFLVSDSDDTTVGPLNLGASYPADGEGVVRVYTTVQAAVNAASAGRGDVVMVLPGYDQSITAADSWNVAGVQILGMGAGLSRPTIRYTGSSGSVGLGANNVRVSNFRFLAAADSVARGVSIDSGFSGISFDNNIFDFNATTNDFRVMLRAGSPRSTIEDNRFIAEDTAGSGRGISLKGGAASYSTIRRNFFYGQFDTVGDTSDGGAPIGQDTTDTADTNLSGLLIQDNVMVSSDTAAAKYIRFSAGYTIRGVFLNNRMVGYDSATADTSKITMNTGANSGLKSSRNYAVGDSGTEKLIGDSFIINV